MSRDHYYRGRHEGRHANQRQRSQGGYDNYRDHYNNDRSERSGREYDRYDSDIYENEFRGRDRGGRRDDDRNFFDRAGERIRETWDRFSDRDDRNDHRSTYYSNDDYSRAQYEGRNNRNNWDDHERGHSPEHSYRGSREWDHDRNYRGQAEREYHGNESYRNEGNYGKSGGYGTDGTMHNTERYRAVRESHDDDSHRRSRRRSDDRDYGDNWSNAYTPMSQY